MRWSPSSGLPPDAGRVDAIFFRPGDVRAHETRNRPAAATGTGGAKGAGLCQA